MKKNSFYIVAIILMVLSLSGCESGAKFRVYNNSSYPLYVGMMNGESVTIPAAEQYEFNIDTQTQSILTGEVKKTVLFNMVGETYNIWDDVEDAYTDTTYVTVKAGQTLSAYIHPNRASIKVINNSSVNILRADIYQNNFTSSMRVATLANINSGTSQFKRVDYATPTRNFYYQVNLIMEDGNIYTYGDQQNVLHVDRQYAVTLNDPEITRYSK
ncbi:MAG: hypothetical protein CVU48_05590 [Candidatus Cloacimonetes bacterium HGW-Cloacimonetes-1]|nr:MAG: hypothetical protein CVU48_05590 [Candidatus Cloacimonetes bacterium HGW-Cloacimonetes-1]